MTDPLFPPLGHFVKDLTPRDHASTAFSHLILFAEIQIAALAALGTVRVLFGLSPPGGFQIAGISVLAVLGYATFFVLLMAVARGVEPLPEFCLGSEEAPTGPLRRALIAGAAWWGRRRHRTLGVLCLGFIMFLHQFFDLKDSVFQTDADFWPEFLALAGILVLIYSVFAFALLFAGMLVDRGKKPGTPDSR